MELRTSLLLTLLFLGEALCDDQHPVVTVAQGPIRGQKVNPGYATPYYSFLGIPYAQPPVGELRFKAPVPAGPWNGTLEAVTEGNICKQPQYGTNNIYGEEDCLFLNVYTTELPNSSALRPVMVWIHGGGFSEGSGNGDSFMQGPEFLLNTGIVYVSLNYRLGILGFLSTEDAVVPGNAAMKDQVLALRWVKQNIAAFGGDPDQVTIFGCSAGAASVSHHVMSPMSAGLFRGAIADSGSAASAWAVQDKPKEYAFLVGKALGFNGESTQDLVTFLRSVPAENLINASSSTVEPEDRYRISDTHGVPCVEPVVDGEEAFMTEHPLAILEKGSFNKVSFLTGVNTAEGMLSLEIMSGQGRNVEDIDPDFTQVFKPEFRYCRWEACGDAMAAKMRSFYFGNESLSFDNIKTFSDMCTDIYFAEGATYSIKKISALSSKPVYFYHFAYNGELNPEYPLVPGPAHGDELGYIFYTGVQVPSDSKDGIVKSNMVSLWTNFVKFENPTPNVTQDFPAWLPYKSDTKHYLEIGAQLKAKTNFQKERMDFWENFYSSNN